MFVAGYAEFCDDVDADSWLTSSVVPWRNTVEGDLE